MIRQVKKILAHPPKNVVGFTWWSEFKGVAVLKIQENLKSLKRVEQLNHHYCHYKHDKCEFLSFQCYQYVSEIYTGNKHFLTLP